MKSISIPFQCELISLWNSTLNNITKNNFKLTEPDSAVSAF